MKNNYSSVSIFIVLLLFVVSSCEPDDEYVPIAEEIEVVEESPVVFDLQNVPYENLSEYNFFEGEMKQLKPVYGVVPYKPGTSLFTDYAKKKRFIWMPKDATAGFNANDEIFDFPVGTVLIKNFYYENVLPSNSTQILETRLMIKQQEEWVFANYIWNEDQTNAVLNMNGGYKSLSWNENSEEKSVNYRIPSAAECLVCHKKNNAAMPIGTKPQNLNLNFSYPEGNKNQLQKLIEAGYLEDDIPTNLAETIMWEDASASLEKRARAYLDVNCAHCHSAGGHCDYVPIKLNLSEEDLYNSGVCMEPVTYFPGGPFVINSGNAHASEMYLRMNSNAVDVMMPIMGRSMIHEEGVQLIEDWINSIETTCE